MEVLTLTIRRKTSTWHRLAQALGVGLGELVRPLYGDRVWLGGAHYLRATPRVIRRG